MLYKWVLTPLKHMITSNFGLAMLLFCLNQNFSRKYNVYSDYFSITFVCDICYNLKLFNIFIRKEYSIYEGYTAYGSFWD